MPNLLASNPGASYFTRGGNFTADANSMIYGVPAGLGLKDLIEEGCIPVPFSPTSNFRNLLDGGDFTTNPMQRNIAGLASSSKLATAVTAQNTPTYFADRWFGYTAAASGGSMNMVLVASTTIAGFSNSLRLQRTAANANTSFIGIGQIVENLDVIRLQGQPVTLSFWAMNDANYSGGSLSVNLYTGTGTNDTATNMITAGWAGTATQTQTQALTGSFNRYQFQFTVPPAATALGTVIGFTPTGTAGTVDGVEFMGIQLEAGNGASPFERRDAQVELEICQRYAFVIAEPVANTPIANGTTLGANVQNYFIPAPVQMLKAPTVTVVAGSFKVGAGAAFASGTTVAAGTLHTPAGIQISSANTAAAGVGAMLAGGGASGYIVASADF